MFPFLYKTNMFRSQLCNSKGGKVYYPFQTKLKRVPERAGLKMNHLLKYGE